MDSATMPAILRRLAVVLCLDPPCLFEDVGSALGEELVCRTNTERSSVAAGPVDDGAHHAAAVERDDGGDQFELIVAQRRGERADRRLAPAAECIDDRP